MQERFPLSLPHCPVDESLRTISWPPGQAVAATAKSTRSRAAADIIVDDGDGTGSKQAGGTEGI